MRRPEQVEIARVELMSAAREELRIGPETGADEFRRTLFERLEKENWLPPTETQYALETLALRSAEDRKAVLGVGSGAFFWSAEKKLREEVERFAAGFFQQLPMYRKAEWTRLDEKCRIFPMLAHRLRGLKPGLDVVVPQSGHDRAMLDLAEHLAQLFTLRPEARAQRRRMPDERLTKTLPQWREAAVRLQRSLPQVASLEPDLVETLATAKVRSHQLAVSRLREPLRKDLTVSDVPLYGKVRRRGGFAESIMSVLDSVFGSLGRGSWVLFVAGSMAIRACSMSSSPTSSPLRYEPLKIGSPSATRVELDPRFQKAVDEMNRKRLQTQKPTQASEDLDPMWPQVRKDLEWKRLQAQQQGTLVESEAEWQRSLEQLKRRREQISQKKRASDEIPSVVPSGSPSRNPNVPPFEVRSPNSRNSSQPQPPGSPLR